MSLPTTENPSELDGAATDVGAGRDRPDLPIRGRTLPRQVLYLALPVLVEQALLYLVGLSDTVLTGRYLGEEQLAAVTVASYALWTVGSLFTVVSVGATALVARAVGGGRWAEANRTCQQALGLALILGVALVAAGLPLAPWFARAMNLDGVAAREAAGYLRIILTVAPLLWCTAAGNACLRGVGDTRTGMWVMILVNLLNIAFSWALVVGLGPLPALGLAGVAAGTAIGEGIGGLVVLGVLARGRSGLRLSTRGMVPARGEVRRILRISIPAAGESLSNSVCQLWFLGLINRLGPTATAAHGVAIRCEAIAFLATAAFSVAASTLTGQYLGAGRPDLAARAARTSWWMGVAALAVMGVGFYTLADPMVGVFLGGRQAGVAALGAPVLRVVAFALPALATINVLSGALRGAGDTRWPWAIVLFGYLAVRLPLTSLWIEPEATGGWGFGLLGAWYAMFVDLTVRGLLVAARFLQGAWRQIEL